MVKRVKLSIKLLYINLDLLKIPCKILAFLKSHDVNVISPDWSMDAQYEYPESAKIAPTVGREMSLYIDWLIENGVPLNKIHTIGYSLGAHVMGAAIRHIKTGKIRYATGEKKNIYSN